MKKIIVQLNVILVLILLVTSCSRTKIVEEKNNQGAVIKKYSVLKKHPEIKDGKYVGYYDDGKLQEISTYVDGKLNGERRLYWPNGKLMAKENYKMNRMDGDYISLYESGSNESQGKYKDNLQEGVWAFYYEQPANTLKQKLTFKEGRIEGPASEYFMNGRVESSGNKIELFEDMDVYDGKIEFYDSLGNLIKIAQYEKGKQISKEEIKK